jgi:mRNA-degrading endonuclease toxin of MazEF toxin-antitoxin module
MADRGDVYRLVRRLGFAAAAEGEAVVVVQATRLNEALPTLVVVPLDFDSVWAAHPLAVRVRARELATEQDHFAITTELRAVRQDRLAPGRVGKVDRRTLAELDRVLRLVLGL